MLDEQATSEALKRLRELSGMSQRLAARQMGIEKRTLRSWESHRSTPDQDQISTATSIYGRGLNSLFTDRQSINDPLTPGIIKVGSEEVDITQIRRDNPGIHDANRATIVAYLDAVRRVRGIPVEGIVELRSVDIQALAKELDISDPELSDLLSEVFNLTPAGAQSATRAVLIGALLALSAVGVIGGSWFAPAASAATATRDASTHQSAQPAGGPSAAPDSAEPASVAPDSASPRSAKLRPMTPLFATSPFDALDPPAEGAGPRPSAAIPGERSAVFSVTPRDSSQDGDSLSDAITFPLGQGLHALTAGSPELPNG